MSGLTSDLKVDRRPDRPAPVWSAVCVCLVLAAAGSGLIGPLASISEKKGWSGAKTMAPLLAAPGLDLRGLLFKPARQAPDDHDSTPTEAELACLALNIYFEARGEPEIGKLAVGHVVMNRVAARSFPKSVCAVVQQGGHQVRHRCQFSWWCDGKSDRPRHAADWQESLALAESILSGQTADPTAGALWYHADYVSPHWKTALKRGPTFGRHIFYSQAGRS